MIVLKDEAPARELFFFDKPFLSDIFFRIFPVNIDTVLGYHI